MVRKSPCLRSNGSPKPKLRGRERAEAWAQELIERGSSPETISVYRCSVCNFFHVGHQFRTARNESYRRRRVGIIR